MIVVSAASRSSYCPPKIKPLTVSSSTNLVLSKSLSLSISLSTTKKRSGCGLLLHRRYPWCRAAKTGPVKKRAAKRKAPGKPIPDNDNGLVEVVPSPGAPEGRQGQPSPLPKPPVGFVLDPSGRVLMASANRLATIVDAKNNLPLECVIRRVFQSSRGDECMLLCPVDTPVQILKSTNFNGWSAVNDDEVETIIPAAAYALAKIHMHLVFNSVIQQGVAFAILRKTYLNSAQDLVKIEMQLFPDNGEDIDGLPSEGVGITCFHLDGTQYMIYTPSDPLLFVAVKDKNGLLQIADDDLLDDPAIIDAIDEETEFNALVEEEAALLESLLGER